VRIAFVALTTLIDFLFLLTHYVIAAAAAG
jgi:hypothetical protein